MVGAVDEQRILLHLSRTGSGIEGLIPTASPGAVLNVIAARVSPEIVVDHVGGQGAVKHVTEKRPDLGVFMGTYSAGYFGLPETMKTISRAKEIDVDPRMPEEVAYAIMKAIYDHPEDTKAIHRDVGQYNQDNALSFGLVIPTHPGAIKYFKDAGVWK